eukprot:Opistho-1_new@28195
MFGRHREWQRATGCPDRGRADQDASRAQACHHARVNVFAPPSTLRRAACSRCLRPQATCLCALVRPTDHHTEVLVLQHPQEQRQAKNSVALLRLSLAHCEVVVGERFEPAALESLLHRPGSPMYSALI